MYNDPTGIDLEGFKQGVVISSKVNGSTAVKGMFGSEVNTTQPHRNVPIGTPADQRPEAYNIITSPTEMKVTQPTGLSSVFFLNASREIFYNIRNI